MKNNETKVILQPSDTIDNVRRLVRESGDSLLSAAQMLKRIVEADPTAVERITQGPDALPEGFVNSLLRIAEKSLHPKLLLNRCPAYQRIAGYAYSSQEEILKSGSIDVVTDAASGDIIKVDLVKLDGGRLRQVFSQAGVRSRDEQRAWLKRRQDTTPLEKMVGPAYIIRKNMLVFMRPCEVSKVEILRLLEQMVA